MAFGNRINRLVRDAAGERARGNVFIGSSGGTRARIYRGGSSGAKNDRRATCFIFFFFSPASVFMTRALFISLRPPPSSSDLLSPASFCCGLFYSRAAVRVLLSTRNYIYFPRARTRYIIYIFILYTQNAHAVHTSR